MARAKKDRVRKPRRSKRDRKAAEPTGVVPPQQEADYWNWLNSKHRAAALLNAHPERPWWASVEYEGYVPVANYYPCTMFRRGERLYYGFLIRDHREAFVSENYKLDIRREYTGADGRSPL